MYNCTCTDKYICITICITGIFNVYKHVTSGYHHPFTGLQKRCCSSCPNHLGVPHVTESVQGNPSTDFVGIISTLWFQPTWISKDWYFRLSSK